MNTGLVCPYRYVRKMACKSLVGFQLASKITTLLAAVKLTPREPALVEIKNNRVLQNAA